MSYLHYTFVLLYKKLLHCFKNPTPQKNNLARQKYCSCIWGCSLCCVVHTGEAQLKGSLIQQLSLQKIMKCRQGGIRMDVSGNNKQTNTHVPTYMVLMLILCWSDCGYPTPVRSVPWNALQLADSCCSLLVMWTLTRGPGRTTSHLHLLTLHLHSSMYTDILSHMWVTFIWIQPRN